MGELISSLMAGQPKTGWNRPSLPCARMEAGRNYVRAPSAWVQAQSNRNRKPRSRRRANLQAITLRESPCASMHSKLRKATSLSGSALLKGIATFRQTATSKRLRRGCSIASIRAQRRLSRALPSLRSPKKASEELSTIGCAERQPRLRTRPTNQASLGRLRASILRCRLASAWRDHIVAGHPHGSA